METRAGMRAVDEVFPCESFGEHRVRAEVVIAVVPGFEVASRSICDRPVRLRWYRHEEAQSPFRRDFHVDRKRSPDPCIVRPTAAWRHAVALGACVLVVTQAVSAREPPAPGCVDLHGIVGGRRTGDREVVLWTGPDRGLRLELEAPCPAFAEGASLQAMAAGGWACPDTRLFVRGGDITCRVTRMRELAVARAASAPGQPVARGPADVLDAVKVRERHWRDITGATDQCVDARFLRGWRVDRDGLVVEVAPQRHAGNRHYRVRTVGSCPELAGNRPIRLTARNGAAAICGRSGDTVVFESGSARGSARSGAPRGDAFMAGCEIESVTPLARD